MNTIKVLIVDDDASARQTMRAHLDQPGFSTIEVSGGLEALEVLKGVDIDVVLLDAMMPEMNGFETCQKIKENPNWEGLPVIMTTALTSQQDRNDGLRAGADDFMSKPINGTELRLRLKAHGKAKAFYSLLNRVLPSSILRRLRDEPGFVADRFEQVTILFSDIVGFVPFSRERTPDQVVGILDDIFRAFDRRCAASNLEKIKTIGDAYMLAGGLHEGEDPADAARRAIEVGLDMFHLLEGVNFRHKTNLQLRVGVNSGPVIAGVIGESRLSYDMWGDTVNLASRMESHGVPGFIQVSPSTKALVGDVFNWHSREPRTFKGVGEMQTFLVEPRVVDE